MKKFGDWTEQDKTVFRAADNKIMTLTPPASITGASLTLTLPNTSGTTDTLVSLTSTATLTNKTLTSPIISSISNVGTLTLPLSNDTLVGKATTDTLTNKSIDADTNTLTNIDLPALKTTANLSVFLQRDGSGNVIDSTKAVPTGVVLGTTDSQVLTNKSIDSDNNTITNIVNADIKAAAAIALDKLAAVTVSRALISDGSGFVSPSSVTDVELGYMSGVTSSVQTQIGTKQADVITTTGDVIVGAAGVAARLGIGGSGTVLTSNGTTASWSTPAGTGDVTSASTITINAITKGDGGAKGIQDSGVLIDGSDNVSGFGSLETTGFIGMGRAPLTELDIYAAAGSNYMNFDTSGTTTQDRGIRFRWSGSSIAEGTNKFEMKHRGSTDDLYFGSNNASNIMVMESGGDIGIGTASPNTNVQLGGSGYRTLQIESTEGGQLLLDHNDAGAGSTLGHVMFQRSGEALAAIQGVTDGATNAGYLSMHTQPTGGAITERMRIDSDGLVGIGTTSALSPLHVHAPSSDGIRLTRETSGSAGSSIDISGDNLLIRNRENATMEFFTNNIKRMAISAAGAVSAQNLTNASTANTMYYNTSTGAITYSSSSQDDKENIRNIEVDSSLIYDLIPKTFERKSSGDTEIGYIAEEVALTETRLVGYSSDEIPKPVGVYYQWLSILAIEEIKKLKTTADTMQTAMEALEARILALEV